RGCLPRQCWETRSPQPSSIRRASTDGSSPSPASRSRGSPPSAIGGSAAHRRERASVDAMGRLRVISYNIHCGIGWDGRFNEQRILDVLKETEPDVVALQEVESRASGIDMLQWLAKGLGFQAVAGTTLLHADGHYGNGLLTRCPVIRSRLLDLSFGRREPRGVISADLDCQGEPIRIVATHLGLRPAERREQVQLLLKLFRESPDDRAVLLGDLNEWF